MAYARISVTLPKGVLAAADRRAKELDRSRSWVIAEALRQWNAGGAPTTASHAVRESAAPPYGAREVAEARHQHLLTDLQRTPAERLRRAGDLAQLAQLAQAGRPRGPRVQIIGFDSYEDFYQWKKARRAGA